MFLTRMWKFWETEILRNHDPGDGVTIDICLLMSLNLTLLTRPICLRSCADPSKYRLMKELSFVKHHIGAHAITYWSLFPVIRLS
ncbi:uncharacterized protein [Rutidosis leptorrhynchoides]|uniref:uncharacterized protein isoform X2 n=1 Tax=Rutidosis leptorrhynchoides TaxID=125765 RepID=UPI003A99C4E9